MFSYSFFEHIASGQAAVRRLHLQPAAFLLQASAQKHGPDLRINTEDKAGGPGLAFAA